MGGSERERPWQPHPPDDPRSTFDALYQNLRYNCAEIETLYEVAEKEGALTAKELKEIDKAVTVMKAGFKIMKRALKLKKSEALKQRLKDLAA